MDKRDSENASYKAYEFINSVKKGLLTKNRFTSTPKFEELIRSYAAEDTNICTIDASTLLYRARIYTKPDAFERYSNPPKGPFRGYSKKDSFVNLQNTYESRCNPSFIPYLYTSTTERCCIHEVRPLRYAYISVAKIRPYETMRILRLDQNCNTAGGRPRVFDDIPDSTLHLYFSHEFSRPFKEPGDYIFCQYASEFIKNLGFDGLSFESSVCKKENDKDDEFLVELESRSNVNVTIFNYNKCRATSSHLVCVDDITVSYVSAEELAAEK